MNSCSDPDIFAFMLGRKIVNRIMHKFYFKFIDDPNRPDYYILAYVRYSDDLSIGWINAAGECSFNIGSISYKDIPIVVQMLKSSFLCYRELLKKSDYE